MSGSLPPSLGNLSYLTAINLRNNSFRDQVPPQIARLSRLQQINFTFNSLSGEFPSNLNTPDLTVLDLAGNNFSGQILDSLASKLKLVWLDLGFNSLTGTELKDGYHLDSAFGAFRLGFFTAADNNRYLGIWYNMPDNQQYYYHSFNDYYERRNPELRHSPVWVSNPDSPILNKTGVLVLASDGNLKIVDGKGDLIVAVTSITRTAVEKGVKTSAVLLDSGNFVLRELNPEDGGSVERQLWQSFDYPTDTLLPGMKLGANLRTGHVWSLKPWFASQIGFSWRLEPPVERSTSFFTFGLEMNNSDNGELVILWKGRVYWRSGKELNQSFRGLNVRYVWNEEERYMVYSVQEGGGDHVANYPRITITNHGSLTGTIGVRCDMEFQKGVGCFDGDDNTPICSDGYAYPSSFVIEAYEELAGRDVEVGGDSQCRPNCSKNCTCWGYVRQNRDGSGCQMVPKLAYSLPESTDQRRLIWLIIAGVVLPAVLFMLFLLYLGWKWRNHLVAIVTRVMESVCEFWKVCGSLLAMWKEYYVLLRLSKATSDAEKEILLHELGMAGEAAKWSRGCYKKTFNKLKARTSLKNEVRLIAKLQHDNLVRLVGCCIEKAEKILVYEYLPNKSLDFSLFAPTDQNALDWKKRLDIIQGIAQGLLYLHKYSRLKIVHRDLKASNILLDGEMNPKISDFGLAKIFHPNESRAITARVAGTFGYMSPEYAMEGVFSTKSDVFSFGVLLLEIVSGKRNNHFHADQEGPSSLIAWAWELWREGRGIELVDSAMAMGTDHSSNNMVHNEALKCIQIGLLCIQENPRDRPSMLEVASMIYNNDSSQLPSPNRPAFYYKFQEAAEIIEEQEENWTVNQVTITEMNAR
ncbi:unnamed protein product [Linum tenue]|uniref:Receptor-like serine/threonine-protein kinase n=1 Tax=Linum tenue TaxID=586396 RepID=A0AAV0KL25_9ROSI|nr:unnamed protein product [Linum tenue]